MIFRKMFIDEVQELSADACLNVSLPVLAAVLCGVRYRSLTFSVH